MRIRSPSLSSAEKSSHVDATSHDQDNACLKQEKIQHWRYRIVTARKYENTEDGDHHSLCKIFALSLLEDADNNSANA
jgi:hypothetical protein